MATYTGNFNGTSDYKYTLVLTPTKNPDNYTTTVKAKLTISTTNGRHYDLVDGFNATVTVDGVTVLKSITKFDFRTSPYSLTLPESSGNVAHGDSGGSKTVKVGIIIHPDMNVSSHKAEIGKVSQTEYITLDSLFSTTSFSVSPSTVRHGGSSSTGGAVTFTRGTPSHSSLTHQVSIQVSDSFTRSFTITGSKTEYFNNSLLGTTKNYNISIPVTMRTWTSRGGLVGATTRTIIVTPGSVSAPSVTVNPSVVGSRPSGLTGNRIVQGKNSIKATMSATASSGTRITGQYITINGSKYTYQGSAVQSSLINKTGSVIVNASATDDFGNTGTSSSVTYTSYEYSNPSITTLSVIRTTSTSGTVHSDSGRYVRVRARWSVSTINNTNSHQLSLQYRLSGGTWRSLATQDTSSFNVMNPTSDVWINIPGTVTSSTGIEVRLRLGDYYNPGLPQSKTITLQPGGTILHIPNDKDGLGIGGLADTANRVKSYWDIYAPRVFVQRSDSANYFDIGEALTPLINAVRFLPRTTAARSAKITVAEFVPFSQVTISRGSYGTVSLYKSGLPDTENSEVIGFSWTGGPVENISNLIFVKGRCFDSTFVELTFRNISTNNITINSSSGYAGLITIITKK